MPIVFGAAERDSGIVYWGLPTFAVIRKSEEHGWLTEFKVTELKPAPGEPPKSTLTLLSSGKQLSDKYIRPYAICLTPDFVKEQ